MGKERIFQIWFNKNQKVFYNGYVVLRKDGSIVGYTDDTIIVGGDFIISEIINSELVEMYDITNILEVFDKRTNVKAYQIMEEGKSRVKITMEEIDPRIPNYQNVKIIEERINQVLKKFPKEIVEYVKMSYLTKGS